MRERPIGRMPVHAGRSERKHTAHFGADEALDLWGGSDCGDDGTARLYSVQNVLRISTGASRCGERVATSHLGGHWET